MRLMLTTYTSPAYCWCCGTDMVLVMSIWLETWNFLVADFRVWGKPVWCSVTCCEGCPSQCSCPQSEGSLSGWWNSWPSTFRWPLWLLSSGCVCSTMSCDTLQGNNIMKEVSCGDCGRLLGSIKRGVYWQGFIAIKPVVHSADSCIAWP